MTALAETVVGGGGGGSPQSPPKPPRESRGSWEHSDKGTGLGVRLIHRSRRTEAPPCSTGPPHRRPTRLLPAGRVGTATSLTQPDCFHEVRHQKTVHDKPRRVLSEEREKRTSEFLWTLSLHKVTSSFSPWSITHIHQAVHFQCFKAPRQPRFYATWQFNQLLQ